MCHCLEAMAPRFHFLVFWSVFILKFESKKEMKKSKKFAHAMKLVKLITFSHVIKTHVIWNFFVQSESVAVT